MINSQTKDMVCIVCPLGCRLTIEINENSEDKYVVTGNKCPRGKVYGIKELTAPTRMVPSTVKIKNGTLSRLPVKTDAPIPKELIFECMKVINKVEVIAPVKLGDIIIKNVLGTGSNIVATRTMDKK